MVCKRVYKHHHRRRHLHNSWFCARLYVKCVSYIILSHRTIMSDPHFTDLPVAECKLHKGHSVLGQSRSFVYSKHPAEDLALSVCWLIEETGVQSRRQYCLCFPVRKLKLRVKWFGYLTPGLAEVKWGLILGFWVFLFIRGTHSYSSILLTLAPALLHCCAKACEREGARLIWGHVLQRCGHIVLENARKVSWGCVSVCMHI